MVINHLKRKIDKYLIDWKKSLEKKPLIVKGARQIGKTESIIMRLNQTVLEIKKTIK